MRPGDHPPVGASEPDGLDPIDQPIHMPRPYLTPIALIMVGAAMLCDLGHNAGAEQTRRTRRSQPVSPAHAAPDMTATIPAPTRPDDETLPTPFYLPAAPRARMRACGEKWQGIKMSGQAGDQTWRDFATKCLAEANNFKPNDPKLNDPKANDPKAGL